MAQTRGSLVILGGGGHGVVVGEGARLAGWGLAGYLDDHEQATLGTQPGPPRLGDLREIERIGDRWWILALGDAGLRKELAALCAGRSFGATIIHPEAFVSPSAELAPGVFVGPGAIVHAHARVAEHAIINSGAIIEHHARIDTGAHIAPGTVLGGNVIVGPWALVGLGARVIPGATIGQGSVVGAPARPSASAPSD